MANSPVASCKPLKRESPQLIRTNSLSLSRTLALRDNALGTTPLSHQQTAVSLLKTDIPYVAAAALRIICAVAISIINRRRETSWIELRDAALYVLMSLLELQLLLSVCLLWLVIPGLALLPWLGLQVAAICILFRRVNKGPQSFTFVAERSRDDTFDGEEQHLDWFVVGGLMHSERMRQELPPKLARIFGHDMHVFLPQRFGFLFDAILILLQRNVYVPTARSVALYESVRTSLLKSETTGVRILAHHTGALDVSWMLSRLCADFPLGDHLSKLQVFTFGAASIEMVLPLGRIYQQREDSPGALYPSITHFAFTDDPFAQIGVLLGIRHRLEGRFVGSLYTIHNVTRAETMARLLPRGRKYTFNDYLDAILPGGDPRFGVLGQICKIDRELSEMRELAALAQSLPNERLRTRRTRLSWTALGVVANSPTNGYNNHDDHAGPYSLEEVRKEIKSLDGRRGFKDNPLADAVRSRYRPPSTPPRINMSDTEDAVSPRGWRTGFGRYENQRRGS
ncbi:hypothetical protein F4804DRAFT_166390 [Jackrogersella minutella]|nr:hypothetical protein F4804DRAFT_166390 [Jackrogersella minutella]